MEPTVKETHRYTATAPNVRAARDHITQALRGHPDVEIARLLVSELAGNAVRHGDGDTFTLTVEHLQNAVHIAVTNTGTGRIPDHVAYSAVTAENGRGLAFLTSFAADWGYTQRSRRTTVWFTLPPAAALLPAA